MRITNQQKKELADILIRHKLKINDFQTSGDHALFTIKYKHEYFSFSVQKTSVSDEYRITVHNITSVKGFNTSGTWENVRTHYDRWLFELAAELNTPTGWETFDSENYLNPKYEELYMQFTAKEKEEVSESIAELKEKILLLRFDEDANKIINSKLDDVSRKVDELSKFDWKSLFIGTIASLILTLAIPPTAAGLLWEYVKVSFSNMRIK